MKKIFAELNEIDDKIMKIINNGLLFSLFTGVIGIMLLLTYNTHFVSYDCFQGGLILVKTALLFSAEFIGLGIAFNKIIKEKI